MPEPISQAAASLRVERMPASTSASTAFSPRHPDGLARVASDASSVPPRRQIADPVDEISGGRLVLGLGAGYHEYEYRAWPGHPS
jgi:alkanesulfonate monooxygenase SsuD/methylene tetrahydromethanopterin reductase-like flavin-dependent oxidoreductase (luciferase family)